MLTREQLHERIVKGVPFNKRCVLLGEQGQQVHVEWHCEFVFDARGRAERMISVCWELMPDEL